MGITNIQDFTPILERVCAVMRTVGRRHVPGLSSLALVSASLFLGSGCGESPPPTGTMAGEAKDAARSTQAQIEFMEKQQGKTAKPSPK